MDAPQCAARKNHFGAHTREADLAGRSGGSGPSSGLLCPALGSSHARAFCAAASARGRMSHIQASSCSFLLCQRGAMLK